MTALPSKHYSGHHKTTQEEGDSGTFGKRDLKKEIWTAGSRYSRRKMEVTA